jgi:hypothetical protein
VAEGQALYCIHSIDPIRDIKILRDIKKKNLVAPVVCREQNLAVADASCAYWDIYLPIG